MLEVFKHNNGHLEDDLSIATAEKGSWINVVNPDSDDLQIVSMVTEIPTDVLKMALDTEERSRVEIEDDYVFVVINIPIILETDSYDTLPLGVFITPDFIVTVCLQETDVMKAFTQNKYPLFYTFKKTRFLFQILFRTATLFLRYLQQINHRTDDIESILRHSMRNREFFMLLELQKSLTFFASALRGNGAVMEKLLRLRRNQSLHHLLKLYEEDEDLLEDVIIENKQAIEMVEMYSNILMNMSDTFASIISNNLNIVMKFLASITIILSVPTTIFSLWGVNVPLPFQENEWGFFLVITIAMICSAVAVALLWMKKWLGSANWDKGNWTEQYLNMWPSVVAKKMSDLYTPVLTDGTVKALQAHYDISLGNMLVIPRNSGPAVEGPEFDGRLDGPSKTIQALQNEINQYV